MTLEIRQSCFPFFPCSLMQMAVICILQLPGNVFHIWLEALKNLSAHRYDQNLLKAQRVCLQWNVPTRVCSDRAGLSLQHLLSFTREEAQWQRLREILQDPGLFWTVVQLSLPLLYFFPLPRVQKHMGSWASVRRLQPSWVQDKFLSGPVCDLMLGWTHTGEQESPLRGAQVLHESRSTVARKLSGAEQGKDAEKLGRDWDCKQEAEGSRRGERKNWTMKMWNCRRKP